MLIKLAGGKVYDPLNGIDGEVRDIYILDDQIVDRPPSGQPVQKSYPLQGKIIMAGAIDLHTHIGGGKVNIARMMLPEDHAARATAHAGRAPARHAADAAAILSAGNHEHTDLSRHR